jgi:hypothetical protein
MREVKKRVTDAFRRDADGTWTCIEAISVDHPDHPSGPLQFSLGAKFHAEDVFMGVKVAKWLDSLLDARHA